MNWSNNKNELEHNKKYLVCQDIKNETYSLLVYFKYDEGDTIFKEEGFYWFDRNNDIFKYSRTQPVCWMNIVKPIC